MDVQQINKQLLKTDYDTAKIIYMQARDNGFSATHSAAIAYRAGYIEGKGKQRTQLNELHKKINEQRERIKELEAKQSLPEAQKVGVPDKTPETLALEEGSTVNE